MERSCESCEFSFHYSSGMRLWECRRHPPVWTDASKVVLHFPTTKPTDWCGEYSPVKKNE